jgi:hypothetical protein
MRSKWSGQLEGIRSRKRDDRDQQRLALEDRRVGLAEGASRRVAEEQQFRRGLARDAAGRAAAQEQRTATKFDREQREQRLSAYGQAYQAAAMGDQALALQIYNQGRAPESQVTSIAVDDAGDMVIDRRGDIGKIPLSRIRRYLPKDPNAPRQYSRRSLSSEPGFNFAMGQALSRFGKTFDIAEADSRKLKAIEDAMVTGHAPEEIAKGLGIKMRPEVEAAAEEVADIDKEIREHREMLGKGDKRYGLTQLRRRTKRVEELERKRDAIAQEYGLRPLEQPEEQPAEVVERFSEFDTNEDGRIDDMDQEYTLARRAVELAGKSDEMRKQIMSKFGYERFAEFEALVAAMQKNKRQGAEQRVEKNRGLGLDMTAALRTFEDQGIVDRGGNIRGL